MKFDPQTRRDLTLLAGVLTIAVVLALLTWLVLPPAEAGGVLKQPSTFFNAPYGTKATYLVLEKLGYKVCRLRRPIDTDTLEGLEALVLLQPIHCLNDYEARVLQAWIREGHNLLVSPPGETPEPSMECAGPHVWFRYAAAQAPAETTLAGTEEEEDDIDEVATDHGIRFDAERPLSWPAADLPIEVLQQDTLGILAFEATIGGGRIIALADVYGLTNRGLSEDDHAVRLASLAARLTDEDRSAPLAFDEYHAGFPHQPDSWQAVAQLLWDERWARAVTQGLLVAVLALIAAGVRFGRPQRISPVRRRTEGEFTQAAGRFLRAARACDVAAATLADYYRERLCRVLHLSVQTDPAELAEVLRRNGRSREADLVVKAGDRQGTISEAEFVQMTQRLEALVEALEHGDGTDDGGRAAHARRAG